jgi:uncharacterized protein (DUF58 family)
MGRGRWTGRGIGALLLGSFLLVAGVWWRYPGLIGLGAGFTVMALLGLLSVVVRAPVTLDRSVYPTEVARYGTCTGTLRVRHAGRGWPLNLDADERVGGEMLPIRVPRLKPGQANEVDYPIPTVRRGVLVVGPLQLRRRGLAGLAVSDVALGEPIEVRVLPRTLPVSGMPAGVRRGQLGTDERVDNGGTNLVSLREYLPGDDLRRLHWATSARSGTLMIREDADPARPHLAVLLDDRAESYRHAEVDFEDAVEVACSLAVAAAGAGHPVRLRTVSGRVDVETPGSVSRVAGDAIRVLSGALADLAATDEPADAEPLPRRNRDVVAVVSGTAAELGPLALVAAGAAVGVVLVIDLRSAGEADAIGRVLTLRGPRAEELIGLWDRMVVS